MSSMFRNTAAFNQDLKDWNVAKVTNMKNMFKDASAFCQDLSAWGSNLNSNLDKTDAFANTGTSCPTTFTQPDWAKPPATED